MYVMEYTYFIIYCIFHYTCTYSISYKIFNIDRYLLKFQKCVSVINYNCLILPFNSHGFNHY